jgi:NAD(P)H-dependent flavin oxidoreductase YrpB (nitropropane dioxygenase family)
MEWKTRVTELLKCKYPIVQGAMAGLGNWQFAAAVAEAGAHGMITASVSRTPEQLREDIKKCKNATDKSFGVNLSFGICPRIDEMLEVCIKEQVPVETAIYKPDSLVPRIKQSGLIWTHKTARVKDAVYAESLGADAVIVVGLEGTGFKNPEQLPMMTTTTWGTRQIKIPFIAGGGLGDGRGFLGALGMGADGIMMGTAFLATKECPTSDRIKQAIVRTPPDNPQLRHRVLASADPKAYAEVMAMRDKMPMDKWLNMLERINLKDENWRDAAGYNAPPTGSEIADQSTALDAGLRMVSLAVAVIDHVPTVKELIDNIVREAEEILNRWEFLKTR